MLGSDASVQEEDDDDDDNVLGASDSEFLSEAAEIEMMQVLMLMLMITLLMPMLL